MKTLPLLAFAFLLLSGVELSNALSCSVCGGNELVPGDPMTVIVVNDEFRTCEDVFSEGSIELNRDECTFLQNLGKFACKCQEGAAPPTNSCKLCQDGSSLLKPSFAPWPSFTCFEMELTAARNDVCPLYQSSLGPYCNCIGNIITSTTCRLCGVGQLLPRPGQHTEGKVSCIEREYTATLSGTCAAMRRDYGDDCCAEVEPTPKPTALPTTSPPTPNPTARPLISPPNPKPTARPLTSPPNPNPTRSPTPNPTTRFPTFQPTPQPTNPIPAPQPTEATASCTLCNDNQVPFNPLAQIVYNDLVQTCQEVHDIGNLSPNLGATKCAFMQDLGQYVCSCQEGEPPPINTCTLCEDKSAIPMPQGLALPGVTCEEMEADARRDFAENCVRYQGVVGSYCGCSNPVASKSVCQICGTGELLPNPQLIVFGFSCIEHEFMASISGTCTAKRDEVESICCRQTASFCFPGDMVTMGVEGSQIPLKDLQVGDYIQDGEASFSRVYTFGHYDKEVKGSYLQIFSGDDSPALELSPEHMVYAGKGRQAVPAGSLQVGDLLLLERGSFVSITNIQTVRRRGAYAPFTESGKLVVNGVMASSYIAMEHDLSKAISNQWLAHLFQAPHRICTRFGRCAESYTEDGISYYVAGLYKAAKWWLKQTHVIKVALFIPVFFVSLTIAAIESMLMNTWTTALVVLLVSLMWFYRVEKIVVKR